MVADEDLGGRGGAAAGFEVDVEAGLLVPAHFLGVEIRRVIATRDPVEREGDLLRRGRRRAECNERRKRDCRNDLHAELQCWG